MEWYKVKIISDHWFGHQEIEFIRIFISLYYKNSTKNGLALYCNRFPKTDKIEYFISAPAELSADLCNLLESYSPIQIDKPNLKFMEILMGKFSQE